jgi:CheY-like chemotaxis protein
MEATQNQFTIVDGAEPTTMPCWKCHATIELLDAAWCFCVTADQTIICPNCMTCACRASNEVRKAFWRNAPSTLWTKRIQRTRLDRQRPKPVETRPEPAPAPVQEGKPVVVIADDSPTIRMMVRLVVENAGCAVVEAMDGAEALRLARALHPKLLITDALMPKLDGRELARLLKSDATTEDIKVVIMSGLYSSRRYSVEALSKFQADGYLTKPVEVDVLTKVIVDLVVAPLPVASRRATEGALSEQVA